MKQHTEKPQPEKGGKRREVDLAALGVKQALHGALREAKQLVGIDLQSADSKVDGRPAPLDVTIVGSCGVTVVGILGAAHFIRPVWAHVAQCETVVSCILTDPEPLAAGLAIYAMTGIGLGITAFLAILWCVRDFRRRKGTG